MKLTNEPRKTSEIYARRFLQFGPDETVISWAERMIIADFKSDWLFILVGEVEPFNKFEIDDLLDRIQQELRLPLIQSVTEATEILATAYIQRCISGHSDCSYTLFTLAEMYSNDINADVLYDFYLLHYAAVDLGMNETQHYWPGAQKGNIEKIIFDRFLRWLKEYSLAAWQQYECSIALEGSSRLH